MFEDRMVAMHARHSIAKTPVDISELVISCHKGVVELNGKIKKPRNFTGELNMRHEFITIQNLIRATRDVKDVIAERVEIVD